MEPITDDLLLRKKMFCVEKERENYIFTQLRSKIEKIALIGWQTITILRHEHLQARLLDSDFSQWSVKR